MNRLVVFRPDVGTEVGLGHLRRCLSLAIALRNEGYENIFDIHEACDLAAAAGFRIGAANAACAVVIDSYRATAYDFETLGRDGTKVIAIDDLGDRLLPVDLVINGGVGAEHLEYPGSRNTALGIEYALLRPEFARDPRRVHAVKGQNLLITLGGADWHGLMPRLIAAMANRGFERIDAVIGPFFDNIDRIKNVASQHAAVRVHCNADIGALMRRADLALTGGGQTICELAATATPAVAIEIAPNQRRNLDGFSTRGVLMVAGSAGEPGIVEAAADAVASLAEDRERRVELGLNGRRLVDGRGAERAAVCVAGHIGNVT